MSLAWRILLSIPVWLVRLAILVVLAVVGLILIPLLICCGLTKSRTSRYFDRTVLQFPGWAWLWSNSEDGVDGLRGGDPAQAWWAERTQGWLDAKRIFVWAALRNPADNLRFVPALNPKLEPARVRFLGMDHEPAKGEGGWYYAWLAGTPYSCIRYETKRFRTWLGWKLKPTDPVGIEPHDTRLIRCDFACQVKRIAS